MKAGQQLSYNGVQVALFPLDYMYVTQTSGPSSGSHCCGSPMDLIGTHAAYPVYAPFDCHQTYAGGYSGGNTRVYASDKPVITPSGTKYVSVQFTHCASPPTKTSYKQGEKIYTTGTAGLATGDHVHLDQSLVKNGTSTSAGVTCAWGNMCYMISGSCAPNKVFYVNDTKIVNSGGYKFLTYNGGTGGTIPDSGDGEVLNWIIPTEQQYLSQEEMDNNAKCFYGYMNIIGGWTLNACAGVLGNLQTESTINPNLWEGLTPYPQPVSSRGFGLVQWTPYTNIINYLKSKGAWDVSIESYGDIECDKILEEVTDGSQWIATSSYPLSFTEFTQSTQSPEYLAMAFLYDYERPATLNQPNRSTQARYYYELLKDWTPVLPGTMEGNLDRISKKFPFIYYLKRKRL